MKPNMSPVFAFLFFELFTMVSFSFCNGRSYMGCIDGERQTLIKFKQDLEDPSNRLASWNGDGDCCKWAGVVCDDFTGHVLELNLRNPFNYDIESESEAQWRAELSGKLNPLSLDLKHLSSLDLSGNNFQVENPEYLGSFGNLMYLNLSRAGFSGVIPHQLGNLSNLQYLDLKDNLGLECENLLWLSSLFSLKYLDLSRADLRKVSNWFMAIISLPSLEILKLNYCQLFHLPPLSSANFSAHLTTLDLGSNYIQNNIIPSWVFGLRRLVFLDLSHSDFQGPIPDGLGNLTALKYLDLSFNEFNSTIPHWFSRINGLKYLSLSGNSLEGAIPRSLGNLTSLQTLDLSSTALGGKIPTSFEKLCNLRSISLMSVNMVQEISQVLDIFSGCVSYGLESLDFSGSQFSGHFTNQLGQFRNLVSLYLAENSISSSIPWSLGNLSSLANLDLFLNGLTGSIPWSLGNLLSLRFISLSYNRLDGPIPSSLGNLSSVIDIGLSDNNLDGSVPSSLGNLFSLTNLDLSDNKLVGSIPFSLGQLSSLEVLDLSSNKLNGTLSQVYFVNLTKLTSLSVSGNTIILKINPTWVPPFQLKLLGLSSCYLGPQFPLWLRSQNVLYSLDISSTGILDNIPSWFWASIGQYAFLVLSHNQIHGEIPNLTLTSEIAFLDFSSNNFSGALPYLSFFDISALDLSNNAFSGTISHFICKSGGNLSNRMQFLKLGENFLSGDIPDCWGKWPHLVGLNLSHNKFTGSLPTSIGTLSYLSSLNLRHNRLSGVIPESFKNCTELVAFDIGENEFVDNIPTWIGVKLSSLMILNFRSNKFDGQLPRELCHLISLQILDLANNNLSGTIPKCINNFSAMATMNYSLENAISYPTRGSKFVERATLVMKGRMDEYSSILNLVRSIDISKNNFSGNVPTEMTELRELQSLNFSHNFFTGKIPENIGAMRSLESIDFSANQLSGKIPQSMSSLTFLNHLNLSNNNLVGKIPSSPQLQSFDASCFTSNNLCGSPLPKNCTDQNVSVPAEDENGNEDEVDWLLYVCMALGFVVGFWCFVGPLLINRKWRYKYCHFLDSLGDKFGCFVRKCY